MLNHSLYYVEFPETAHQTHETNEIAQIVGIFVARRYQTRMPPFSCPFVYFAGN